MLHEPNMTSAESSENDRLIYLLSENPRLLETNLDDGTNVSYGTLFRDAWSESSGIHVDFSNSYEAPKWKTLITPLIEEFQILRQFPSVSATLEQKRSPAYLTNGTIQHRANWNDAYRNLFYAGGENLFSATQLLDADTGHPLSGLFPFLDARGTPISFPNGDPIAYRLGLTQNRILYQKDRYHEIKPSPFIPQFSRTLTAAGQLLLDLPTNVLRQIWKGWGKSAHLSKDPLCRWIDALFEYNWQQRGRRPPLKRRAYLSGGHTSIYLRGNNIFPRLPNVYLKDNCPHEGGYPFNWSSDIEDIVSSSMDLLGYITSEEREQVQPMDAPLRIFCSYSHKDKSYIERLKEDLRPLERSDKIKFWFDRCILPSFDIDQTIIAKMDESDIFIFLLTPNFLASDYCTQEELQYALSRAKKGQSRLVGIIVRPCNWQAIFPHNLLVLPKDAKAITKWRPPDDAWLDINKRMSELLLFLRDQKKPWNDIST